MKQFSKDLGNVCLAPKGKWSKEQEYERLALVYNACNNLSYVAKIDVPIGVEIDNREYWQPMNATGYSDNNFINLTAENENGTITAYESLEEAVATIVPVNRRAGATLSFYNLNSDRLDRQAEFELWQFNSTDLANWENKDYWNNIYYNWNVFAGWYVGADALKNHVKIPNVGQYAYVGSNLNDAILYQCRTNGTWTNTGIKVRNYISVVVSGNITIGENGNWFSNGEDTGIPATPAVDEQIDNIITKHESLSRTVQGIAATGGANTATNVTYDNNVSGLNAENAQDAIDELSSIGHFAKRGGTVNISTNYNSINTAEVLTLAQAIAKVPSADRVLGFQGKYLATDGWHTIIYTGNSLTSWSDTTKWIDLADKVFNSIFNNATFAGIATPATNPGTPEGNVFYLAHEAGDYINFGNFKNINSGIKIFYYNANSKNWILSDLSDKYRRAYIGLDLAPATISSNNLNLTINLGRYIYTESDKIYCNNKEFSTVCSASGLITLYLKTDLSEIIAVPYNKKLNDSLNYILLGHLTIDKSGNISKPYFYGIYTINGKEYSLDKALADSAKALTNSAKALTDLAKAPQNVNDKQNLYLYVYDVIYLIENQEYTIFKDSIYYNKEKGFSDDYTQIVAVTDSDVRIGDKSVTFNSKTINGITNSSGIKNILGIYINSKVNEQGISIYGVRCNAKIAKNINGKAINYCAIGDSQTDNGQANNTHRYLKSLGFTLNGIGLLTDFDGNTAVNNEGRSGWRFENIVGRCNAMGWRAIEVIKPCGNIKNTSDFLHNNPFIKKASTEDIANYPDRCYTYTAESQQNAHYFEKSYKEVLLEGGNTNQDFYIFDIANYFKVQHDWDGNSSTLPVEAISFAFSTNEFIIEKPDGYDAIIERLIDNMTWVMQVCKKQIPSIKIAFIPCPAWDYGRNYVYINVLKWFKKACEAVDAFNSENSTDYTILQPNMFMTRTGYSYNRGNTVKDVNDSMIKEYAYSDNTHFDSIGYQQYAKAVGSWLAFLKN